MFQILNNQKMKKIESWTKFKKMKTFNVQLSVEYKNANIKGCKMRKIK